METQSGTLGIALVACGALGVAAASVSLGLPSERSLARDLGLFVVSAGYAIFGVLVLRRSERAPRMVPYFVGTVLASCFVFHYFEERSRSTAFLSLASLALLGLSVGAPGRVRRWASLTALVVLAGTLVVGVVRQLREPPVGPRVSLELVLVDDVTDPFAALDDALLISGMARERERVGDRTPTFVTFTPAPPLSLEDAVKRCNAWVEASARLPAGRRVAWGREETSAAPFRLRSYVLSGAPIFDRDGVREAEVSSEDARLELRIALSHQASRKLAEATRRHVGERIAILLDGVVESSPIVMGAIEGGHVVISLGPDSPDGRNAAETLAAGLRGSLYHRP